ATRARAALARNPDQMGFCAITMFLLLASLRDIYLWSIFQDFSPLHVAILSFTLSGIFFLPLALTRHRQELRLLSKYPQEVILTNVACAVSWITYFSALRGLEPALAQMLSAGMGPITADLVERRGSSSTASSSTEFVLHLGIVVSLLLAVVGQPSHVVYGVVM